MEHQNWEPQVMRKTSAQIKADAIRKGNKETVERKPSDGGHMAKLEREEYVKPKMLTPESRQELLQLRLGMKLTQQELDQKCAFPPHTINHLESNKRAPSPRELQMLNRILKCGLKLE